MPMTQVEHTITVAAPAATVATIVSDVTLWPLHFPPTVHAQQLEAEPAGDGISELIRLWAMANGELRTWTSRRQISAGGHRVDFQQVVSQHPVAAMGGTWVIEEAQEGTLVRLLHHYTAVDDDPQALALIARAVDTNSRSELAALKVSAERVAQDQRLVHTFEDTLEMDASAEAAYAFIRDAGLWPERLGHVSRLDMTEVPAGANGGLQVMEMDTRSPDGSIHTTRSGRVCFDDDRIVYKQTTLPAGLAAHIGQWSFTDIGGGKVSVTSRHTVILDPAGLAKLPQPPADLDQARAAVRHALGSNSRATLSSASLHLGSAEPVSA